MGWRLRELGRMQKRGSWAGIGVEKGEKRGWAKGGWEALEEGEKEGCGNGVVE